jgi:hypothetical protein
MREIYQPNLDVRIHKFLKRKTHKYPELRIFDGKYKS